MANTVTNILTFHNVDAAQKLISHACKIELLDFERLIPQPLNIYQGDLSKEDEEDFGDSTWLAWRLAHWGVKWNARNGTILFVEDENDILHELHIIFQTASRPPYPIIAAVANWVKVPFKHRHLGEEDEGMVEEWMFHESFQSMAMTRKIKRKMAMQEVKEFHKLIRKISDNN